MFTPCISSDVMETPLRAIPESKKSFLPSLSEKQKVGQHNQPILNSSQWFTTILNPKPCYLSWLSPWYCTLANLGGEDGTRDQDGMDEATTCKEK